MAPLSCTDFVLSQLKLSAVLLAGEVNHQSHAGYINKRGDGRLGSLFTLSHHGDYMSHIDCDVEIFHLKIHSFPLRSVAPLPSFLLFSQKNRLGAIAIKLAR